ncbi:Catechol 2,3-dioxygenase [Paraoerskovia marina]|uniref:Catechol 2,3-dioxygenase n=1 Tax=Paraoerskovia marina TaxID=545619 RepID=A0A1H1MVQ1_9CELL|nr:VOC family protein [Paraoerskovia marina]SDR90692.1 Catechol 2,3-dioxygenase [Paraoerskovia marina]
MHARIYLTSVFVPDQAAALAFYTEKLGFVVHDDIPLGEDRWLTVTAADDTDGTQLLLEPNAHPAARAYTAALAEDGIPAASFQVDDVTAAHAELVAQGVRFVQDPVDAGPVTTAVLDDTCGNLIQLVGPRVDQTAQ